MRPYNFGSHSSKPLNGWSFVGKGQLLNMARTQSFVFSQCYDDIKNVKSIKERESIFDQKFEKEIKPVIERNVSLFVTSENGAKNAKYIKDVRDVFIDNDKGQRLSVLKEIESYVVRDSHYNVNNSGRVLLSVGEAQMEMAFKTYIDKHTNLSTESGVTRVLNSVRSAFFNIGRCHAYGDGEDIKDTCGIVIANSGNPVSDSCRKNVIDYFNKEHKGKRMTKLMVSTPDEVVSLKKMALSVNVAVVYYVIISLFSEVLDATFRLNSSSRLVNIINLCMLYMFLLHEGARPGDVLGFKTSGEENRALKKGDFGQMHKNMYFFFGKQYYMLVLVFVRPETLEWLMNSGHMTRYILESYKGKQADGYRARWKSWFQIEHNSLDLATIYIVLMRIWVFKEIDSIKANIFKKGLDINRLKEAKTSKFNIEGFTSYSIRYGAAEEDVAFGIPSSWTRFRMGHSELSTIHQKYAENKFTRANVCGENLVLACDICEKNEIIEDEGIPLCFHPIKKFPSIVEALPLDVPLWVISDLEAVRTMLTPFFEGSKELCDCVGVSDRIPNTNDALADQLRNIPLGRNFHFRDGLLPEILRKRLEKEWTFVSKHFRDLKMSTESSNPLLSAFPQVMYGEWNKERKEQAKKMSVMAFTEVRQKEELFQSLAIELGKPTKQVLVNNPNPPQRPESAHVAIMERNMLKSSHIKPSNGFIGKKRVSQAINTQPQKRYSKGKFRFSKLEIGDVLALKLDHDVPEQSIMLPRCDVPITVMYVTGINFGKREVVGNIYSGKWDDLEYNTTSQKTYKLTDYLIAHIWSLDKDERPIDFKKIDGDSAKEIVEYLDKTFRV